MIIFQSQYIYCNLGMSLAICIIQSVCNYEIDIDHFILHTTRYLCIHVYQCIFSIIVVRYYSMIMQVIEDCDGSSIEMMTAITISKIATLSQHTLSRHTLIKTTLINSTLSKTTFKQNHFKQIYLKQNSPTLSQKNEKQMVEKEKQIGFNAQAKSG